MVPFSHLVSKMFLLQIFLLLLLLFLHARVVELDAVLMEGLSERAGGVMALTGMYIYIYMEMCDERDAFPLSELQLNVLYSHSWLLQAFVLPFWSLKKCWRSCCANSICCCCCCYCVASLLTHTHTHIMISRSLLTSFWQGMEPGTLRWPTASKKKRLWAKRPRRDGKNGSYLPAKRLEWKLRPSILLSLSPPLPTSPELANEQLEGTSSAKAPLEPPTVTIRIVTLNIVLKPRAHQSLCHKACGQLIHLSLFWAHGHIFAKVTKSLYHCQSLSLGSTITISRPLAHNLFFFFFSLPFLSSWPTHTSLSLSLSLLFVLKQEIRKAERSRWSWYSRPPSEGP